MDLEILLQRLTERALTRVSGHRMLWVPALQFDHFVDDVRRILRDDTKRISCSVCQAGVAEFEGDVACFFARAFSVQDVVVHNL